MLLDNEVTTGTERKNYLIKIIKITGYVGLSELFVKRNWGIIKRCPANICRASFYYNLFLCLEIFYSNKVALKFCTLWIPWKRNYIPDIAHTGYKLHQALKTKPKARMRTGAKFPGFQIPP